MRRTSVGPHSRLVAVLVFAGMAAGWVLTSRAASFERTVAAGQATGGPQLVSVDPLPAAGEQCPWPQSAGGGGLSLDNRIGQASYAPQGRVATSGVSAQASTVFDRAPTRTIRDTYPTYSAITVNTDVNEVYLQDENLFGYKVFDRLASTPPKAAMTEPKRSVRGLATKMDFNCGLYTDPKTGDLYSVANDTVDTLVVFPRDAQGNVAPKRELKTPHGTYGVAVDEQAEELFLTVQHSDSVVVFRKSASGDEKPLRTLRGDGTGLADPHGIAVDSKNQWLFVANYGNWKENKPPYAGRFQPPSITVHPLKAAGDTPALRAIVGPKTQLNWPSHIFVDAERGELFVANDVGNSILVFRATDSGDVAPIRIVKGPKTNLRNPTGLFVDFKNDELWASNMGNHRATVYDRAANGNVAPRRTIRSAPEDKIALAIGNPGGTVYDSKRDELLVPN